MIDEAQTKILAQAVYDIRLLLSNYLGSQNEANMCVRAAAHLAYALHNEALAVIEDGNSNLAGAIARIRRADEMLGGDLAPNYEKHLSES